MICSSIVAWVAGGLAVASVATVGTVVIITSGPAADSRPLAAATETASPVAFATATPTPPGATPTATPTATPATTPVPSPTPAAVVLGVDGWPIITCPSGFEVYKAATRKLSLCAPAGWRGGIAQEFSGGKDEPEGYIQFLIVWTHPDNPYHFVGLQIVSRESRGTRDTWQLKCATPVADQLLRIPGERCFGDTTTPNGVPLSGGVTWGLEIFAETPEYWVILDAAGTQQTSEAIAAAREDARLVGARAAANGLARLQ